MKRQKLRRLFLYLGLCVLTFAAAILVGCGSGDSGPAGPAGEPGEDGVSAPITITGTQAKITLVTAPTSTVVGTVVDFEVTNQEGQPVTSLPDGISINFTFVKLLSDAAGNTQWKSYINSTATGKTKDSDGNTIVPALASATQASYQAATDGIVNLGSGRYRYTFTDNKVTNVAFEPSLTHRIGMQMSGGGLAPVNTVYDFVPAGGAVTTTRKIATTASCLECHQGNFGLHGGSRVEVEYCVTCHNPGTTDPESGNTVDMATMVHKLHRGAELPSGSPYMIYGYNVTKHDYSEVVYPQDIRNCVKCHKASTKTPDGNNWKTNPTRAACGGCHDDLITGATLSHAAGTYTNDLGCSNVLCHGPSAPHAVDTAHLTAFATPNNASVTAGLANFEYVITSATVTNNRAEVTFEIKKDGTPVTFEVYTAGVNTTTLLAGFTNANSTGSDPTGGGPAFILAYAQSQDGVTDPADFNNSITSASAATLTLAKIWDGTRGTLVDNGGGSYTATIGGGTENYTTADFPAGATMRTVGIQGYFNQVSPASPRRTKGVIKTVTGDVSRRKIVDSDKCAKCHEWLGADESGRERLDGGSVFHGGSRVYNVDLCVMCHNTGKNSGSWSSNAKDAFHSLHAGAMRQNDFTWHATVGYQNVAYPGNLANCESCHLAGTYDYSAGMYTSTSDPNYYVGGKVLLDRFLVSTSSGTGLGTAITTSPITAGCVACHDSTAAQAHMELNGGSVKDARSGVLAKPESCMVCHGPGRSVSVTDVHNPSQAVGH